jgi:hypothetical protein
VRALFFLKRLVFFPALILAQRVLAAAASLARVAAETREAAAFVGAPRRIELRRFSSVSICRRIEIASSKALTEMSMKIPFSGRCDAMRGQNSPLSLNFPAYSCVSIEWQRIGNQIDAAFIFARVDFVNMHFSRRLPSFEKESA